MKAVVFSAHGGVERLRYEEVPEPQPGPSEVVIRVRAAACNYNDIWARQGIPGMEFALPHISGSDVAGEVIATGSGVRSVRVGDEVVVHCGLSCRHCDACTRGEEFFCRQFKLWGFQTGPLDGGYAEYVKMPEVNVLPKPPELSWEGAASLPLVLVTVWRKLVVRAGIRPGDVILVWGAAGGMGVMAVQMAKIFNATVIAVASSDEKLEAVQRLGADHLINRKEQDVVAEVKGITARRGVDIVFEHPGMATWPLSLQCVCWGGTIVTSGATSGYEAITDLRHIFFRQLTILGSTLGSKADLMRALSFVERGAIRPVVGQIFPLREAARAQTLMEGDGVIGKIVLVP